MVRRQRENALGGRAAGAEKLGLKDLRLHDLRHEATSKLFEKDLSPIEVATMTGHKTLNTLKRYTHPNVTEIARKLGYPFIFLNLVLSCLAAVQAPVIMMSQILQEARDRLHAMRDYQVNLKANSRSVIFTRKSIIFCLTSGKD